MEKIFSDYIKYLVWGTFGFMPKVRIEMPNQGIVKIYLDGSVDERRQMMGHNAQNFHAMKQLLICFSKTHNVFVYLYLEFDENYQPKNQGGTY